MKLIGIEKIKSIEENQEQNVERHESKLENQVLMDKKLSDIENKLKPNYSVKSKIYKDTESRQEHLKKSEFKQANIEERKSKDEVNYFSQKKLKNIEDLIKPKVNEKKYKNVEKVPDNKYEVIEIRSSEKANEEWFKRGYCNPPYKPNTETKIIYPGNEKFVRTFSYKEDGTSNKLGGWIMKKSDIKGLNPKQIANKYALPRVPTHICDVNVPANFKLQTGIANKVDDWGKGGGQQFDTIGKRLPISSFTNERKLKD